MSRVMKRIQDAMHERLADAPEDVFEESAVTRALRKDGEPPAAKSVRAAWRERFTIAWIRHRRVAIPCALACAVAVLVGGVVIGPSYQAAATLMFETPGVQSEWDMLRNETRDVDIEEQIRSLHVIEPALRHLQMFPPKPSAFRWLGPRVLTATQEQQALVAMASDFQRSFDVERVQHSSIIRITVKSRNPVQTADRANAIAQAFIDSLRVRAMERVEYQVVALDEKLLQAQGQLKQMVDLRGSVVVDETMLQELIRQLAAADTRLSQLISRYVETSPVVQQAEREKDVLEDIVRQRAEERRTGLVQPMHDGPTPEFIVIQEPVMEALEASIQQTTSHYQELLKQRGEAELTLALLRNSPPNRFQHIFILEPALPSPLRSWQERLAVSLVAAALLCALTLFLLPIGLSLWHSGAFRDRSSRIVRRVWRSALSPSDRTSSPSQPDRAGVDVIADL